jgi:hypothetical protein
VYNGYYLYITNGAYTNSGGQGVFQNTVDNSTKKTYVYNAPRGGIVGQTDTTVSNCYNTGTISEDYCKTYTTYLMYYKWRASFVNANVSYASKNNNLFAIPLGGSSEPDPDVFLLLIYTYTSFYHEYVAGNIVGRTTGSVDKCYYSTAKTYDYQMCISQTYYLSADKSQYQSCFYSTSWEQQSHYLETTSSGAFYTKHIIDASDFKKIHFKVKYSQSGSEQSETTVYSIPTGLTSKSYTDRGTAGSSNITVSNLGTAWATNSSINDGYPYLKDLYWS